MINRVNSVSNVDEESWCDRNANIMGQISIVIGIALCAISVGYLVVSASSINTPALYGVDGESRNLILNVDLFQSGGALLAIVPLGIGFIQMALGGTMLYKYNKKQKVEIVSLEETKITSRAKKWKIVALTLGFAIAMFGVGMIIASSVLLKHQIPAITDLINNHPSHSWSPNDSWWQSLNSVWLNPTQAQLNLFLTAGIFTVIAGGGLMVAGVGTTTIKEKWNLWRAKLQSSKAKQMENEAL